MSFLISVFSRHGKQCQLVTPQRGLWPPGPLIPFGMHLPWVLLETLLSKSRKKALGCAVVILIFFKKDRKFLFSERLFTSREPVIEPVSHRMDSGFFSFKVVHNTYAKE